MNPTTTTEHERVPFEGTYTDRYLAHGKIRVRDIAYHRNGVCGEGFHVVLFRYGSLRMVATVFDGPGRIAVLNVDQTALSNLQPHDDDAKCNQWRGDRFETAIRTAIADYEASRSL